MNKYRFSIHQCQENIDLAGKDSLYICEMDKTTEQEISRFVKEAREAMGITQLQLSEKMSCTKGNVSAWENGRHQPSYSQMLWLSSNSGVPLPHENTEGKMYKTNDPKKQAMIEMILALHDGKDSEYAEMSLRLVADKAQGHK